MVPASVLVLVSTSEVPEETAAQVAPVGLELVVTELAVKSQIC